jgi:hypothetical protein
MPPIKLRPLPLEAMKAGAWSYVVLDKRNPTSQLLATAQGLYAKWDAHVQLLSDVTPWLREKDTAPGRSPLASCVGGEKLGAYWVQTEALWLCKALT